MKKIILLTAVIFTLVLSLAVNAEETHNFSLADKIESFKLINNSSALEGVSKANQDFVNRQIESEIDWYIHTGRSDDIESMKRRYNDIFSLIPEKSYCFYTMITTGYAKQYADVSEFEYLIDDVKIWPSKCKVEAAKYYYTDEDFNEVLRGVKLFDDESFTFLEDLDKIEELVEESVDENIIDCKIVTILEEKETLLIESDLNSKYIYYNNIATILYLKGETNDYGIVIYNYDVYNDEPTHLEKFKVYTISAILESCGNYVLYPKPQLIEQKPVYEEEITALMEEGLIAGTDKGAEPLKPLSRIEATAILVRILGLEDTPTSQASYFTDIASDNWGAKYANIAYENGIAAGVGDNEFAPDKLITSSQFASLLLRSQNEPNDWQTAINTFVERGIITQEQADKMDLFTRGDMAKIIYEAREKGLI